jgi:hypothetical protein
MQTIKLMADYQSYPLWWAGGQRFGDIDPATLPISQELIDALLAWADRFDANYNSSDPAQSGFDSSDAASQFDGEGLQLWSRLRDELPSEYKIVYQSLQREQLLETPEQLGRTEPPNADTFDSSIGLTDIFDKGDLREQS